MNLRAALVGGAGLAILGGVSFWAVYSQLDYAKNTKTKFAENFGTNTAVAAQLIGLRRTSQIGYFDMDLANRKVAENIRKFTLNKSITYDQVCAALGKSITNNLTPGEYALAMRRLEALQTTNKTSKASQTRY